MSTDRELLEMAAKAVGLRIVDRSHPVSLYVESDGCKCGVHWNPLADDGDALRCAVKLHIDLKLYDGHVVAWFDGGLIGTGRIYYGDDPAAATRLAIVRAAAEIGRAMP